MKRILPTYALLFVSLIVACSQGATKQEKAIATKQTADVKEGEELHCQLLQNQIEQIASAAKGRVGVAAVVLKTGGISFQ